MRCQTVIKPIICGLHPRIILQQNSFVFKPKYFWMLHLSGHLYSKPCVFLWVANFRGLTASFTCLPTLSRAFTVRHICITKNTGLSPKGVSISACYYPTHIFIFMHTTMQPCSTLSHRTEPTQSKTKCSVDYNHALTPMSCDVPMHKCNVMRHCMLYHATCIINATLTHNSTPLTGCHGQSHHLHMTSIHHFIHVNISCMHISTSTYNMSFYIQAMTHIQSSHVMAICT